jgi:hypothetical protein
VILVAGGALQYSLGKMDSMNMEQKHMVALLVMLVTLLMTSASQSAVEDSSPLHQAAGKYEIYVSQGAGEPASYGSYSVRVFCDCEPPYLGGVIHGRNGEIVKWWLADIDSDAVPEIIVWIRGSGSGEVASLDVYKFANKKLFAIALPQPSDELLAGYQGHDGYRQEKDGLVRSFPIYKPEDPNARPTGGIREIKYSFATSSWSLLTSP